MNKPSVIIASAFIMLALAGCSHRYSTAEAKDIPGSTIETIRYESLVEYSSFDYVDEDGNIIALDQCEYPEWEDNYCSDSDGRYTFTWENSRYGITYALMTTNLTSYELACNDKAGDDWTGEEVCIPNSIIESSTK